MESDSDLTIDTTDNEESDNEDQDKLNSANPEKVPVPLQNSANPEKVPLPLQG